MKKIASILLLLLFLFNVGGYFIVLVGLRHHVNHKLEARLDAGLYNPDETVEFKIPVTLPYPLQEQGFQRVDGKFEHEGQFFKLVEHKVDNDTLYVICVRNDEEKSLVTAFRGYMKLTANVPATSNEPASILVKFLADFESVGESSLISLHGWSAAIAFCDPVLPVISRTDPVFSPPPEV